MIIRHARPAQIHKGEQAVVCLEDESWHNYADGIKRTANYSFNYLGETFYVLTVEKIDYDYVFIMANGWRLSKPGEGYPFYMLSSFDMSLKDSKPFFSCEKGSLSEKELIEKATSYVHRTYASWPWKRKIALSTIGKEANFFWTFE